VICKSAAMCSSIYDIDIKWIGVRNISNRTDKPKKSSEELIRQLEDKGVKFELCSKEKALDYFQNRNNYMRLASYRKNYEKDGNGKYISLDFAYLIELSTLDMHIRNLVIKMCLEIEHCLKVKLIQNIENNMLEDGYDIVEAFLSEPKNAYILTNLARFSNSHYNGDLIRNYFVVSCQEEGRTTVSNDLDEKGCPAWVLTELLQFGDFLNFYRFYYDRYGLQHISYAILNLVKSLRNACAHNNCILHDLHKSSSTKAPRELTTYISKVPDIGQKQRIKKLSSTFILEFSAIVYIFDSIVSDPIKKHTFQELKDFADLRLTRNYEFFSNNFLLKTSIDFLKKVIDNL